MADLGASTVLEETSYFDRDYLAEYEAFYSTSAAGYGNKCKRLHFFCGDKFGGARVNSALGGSTASLKKLRQNYLGFIVLRPIPTAPLGRTVLPWYPDNTRPKRFIESRRVYTVHIGGIELSIEGLAWQQQDTGVSACATVSLWSALHSAAFDETLAVPTTPEITKAAHALRSEGSRVFPAFEGLTVQQMCDAISNHNLAPMRIDADLFSEHGRPAFSRQRFAASCTPFLRSGYPIIVIGHTSGDDHAVCASGYRAAPLNKSSATEVQLLDSQFNHIYLHDDNIGPNVRFGIKTRNHNGTDKSGNAFDFDYVCLEPDAPDTNGADRPDLSDHYLIPHFLVVAAHRDIRLSPNRLHSMGHTLARNVMLARTAAKSSENLSDENVVLGTQYTKLSTYLGTELSRTLGHAPKRLRRARIELIERVPPMSLHIGVVRLALTDQNYLCDVLYDTTDTDQNLPVFATIVYGEKIVFEMIKSVEDRLVTKLGVLIDATA